MGNHTWITAVRKAAHGQELDSVIVRARILPASRPRRQMNMPGPDWPVSSAGRSGPGRKHASERMEGRLAICWLRRHTPNRRTLAGFTVLGRHVRKDLFPDAPGGRKGNENRSSISGRVPKALEAMKIMTKVSRDSDERFPREGARSLPGLALVSVLLLCGGKASSAQTAAPAVDGADRFAETAGAH